MFRYLGEKFPISDADSDVYHCEVWFIFVQCMCVLFSTDVTAIKRCDVMCLVRRTFNSRNNDYVTMFHIDDWPPVEDSQPCTTDTDNGLFGLWNARRQVTITSAH